MKKIFLTIAITGTLGLFTAQAQTQRGTTSPEKQNTMQSDTSTQTPMRGQQGQGMNNDEDMQRMEDSDSQQNDRSMQQDTSRMEDSQRRGMGAGTGEDAARQEGVLMAEPDTIQFNEPIMDRKFKNERTTDPNRSRDNMKRSTDPNRTGSGTGDPKK